MTLHVDRKSGEVCTCFWLTLPDSMVFLCRGYYLLYLNDNNKMATDVTFMWINKWIFLIVAHFRVVGIFDWILLIEVFQMKIFNRIILSSILELLLWSTGKVCTCFKKYWFHVKSHQKQVPLLIGRLYNSLVVQMGTVATPLRQPHMCIDLTRGAAIYCTSCPI